MTRIAVISTRDSADPAAASGTSYGLTRALESLGVEVVRVSAALPLGTRRPVAAVTLLRWYATGAARLGGPGLPHLGIETVAVRDWLRRRRMRDVKVDAMIQLSSDFLIETDVPYLTYEDMTIRQAVDAGYSAWQLPRQDLEWRIDYQRRGYERAAGCCTRSAWAARSIVEDYGIPAERVKVVGVGANHEMTPAERRWDPPRFLFVAADWERKNGPMLLSAFAKLRERFPHARLDVVGRHPPLQAPGVYGHGYLSLSDPANVAVVKRLFDSATCLVLPSLHEPLGISHVEAAAAGIPSIGSTAGGAREVIGTGGLVIDPTSPDGLLEAMVELSDPVRAQEAGRRGLARAALYTWPRVAERMLLALGLAPPSAEPVAFLDGPGAD